MLLGAVAVTLSLLQSQTSYVHVQAILLLTGGAASKALELLLCEPHAMPQGQSGVDSSCLDGTLFWSIRLGVLKGHNVIFGLIQGSEVRGSGPARLEAWKNSWLGWSNKALEH